MKWVFVVVVVVEVVVGVVVEVVWIKVCYKRCDVSFWYDLTSDFMIINFFKDGNDLKMKIMKGTFENKCIIFTKSFINLGFILVLLLLLVFSKN